MGRPGRDLRFFPGETETPLARCPVGPAPVGAEGAGRKHTLSLIYPFCKEPGLKSLPV
jgi:hypothetical protein